HAAAAQHLRLEDHGACDLGSDPLGVAGSFGDAALQERGSVTGEKGLGLVLVESHGVGSAEVRVIYPPRRGASRRAPACARHPITRTCSTSWPRASTTAATSPSSTTRGTPISPPR